LYQAQAQANSKQHALHLCFITRKSKSYLAGLEDLFLLVFEDFVDFGW
jgi:hypothetical protein